MRKTVTSAGSGQARTAIERQAELRAELRRDSYLRRDIPLALPQRQLKRNVEVGPTVDEWFEAKHRRGEFGSYFPLHLAANRRVS